jgi:chromosome segregation ATPase
MREGFAVTEIFLSYDSSDRERVRLVRDALAARGFGVHWEQEAPAGTAASAHSNRVSLVAALARQHGKLIVVRLEVGTGTDGLNLADWTGDQDHPGWQELCRRIEAKLRSSLWVQRLIQEAETERTRWRVQYETSAGRCKSLNDELAAERSERGAAQDQVAGLRALLDADAKARFKLEARIVELEQRLAGAEDQHAGAGQQLAEAQTALSRVEDEAARLRTDLAAAEATNAELQSGIASRDAVIQVRDSHIADLDARLAQRDASVSGLRADVAARDADVAGLSAGIEERDANIASLQADLAGRDTDIAGLRADMADLEASAAQRDTHIADLRSSIAERHAYMADLEASIAQRDTHIADLKTGIAERDTHIADLKASLTALERRPRGSFAGVPLPAVLSRLTLPVLGLTGIALSLVKMRQG